MVNPSDHSIERLFSLLSHELRTPITTLQGAIALLQTHQVDDPAEVDGLLNLAADSADRLDHLIRNILDWYDITRGEIPLLKQRCNVATLIQQVIDDLRGFAFQRRIHIYLHTPHWIPVEADLYYLNNALSHLLHNAIKYSKPGCSIRITAERIPPAEFDDRCDASSVQIVIHDQGRGIPEAFLEKIFYPFLQIDSSDTRPYEGLGLDLAICHEIIRQHGGKIWVESQPGQGTSFYVVLPLQAEEASSHGSDHSQAGSRIPPG